MKKIVVLSILGLILLTGCRVVGGGVRVNIGQALPPAHAPAHGRSVNHLYHYYPDAEFYFDTDRNLYHYLDSHAQWTFSVNLPIRLRSHLDGGYVEIEMEGARPYLRHKHHRIKYKKHRREFKKKKYRKKHKRDRDAHHRGRGRGW